MSDTAPTDIIAPIDETSDLSERFNPLEERRRAIYERLKGKVRRQGYSHRREPWLPELVGEWIAGRLEMVDVAKIHSERKLLTRTRETNASRSDVLVAADAAAKQVLKSHNDLLDEMERSIGIYEPGGKSE